LLSKIKKDKVHGIALIIVGTPGISGIASEFPEILYSQNSLRHIQSNLVITNSSGPDKFVSYNRDS